MKYSNLFLLILLFLLNISCHSPNNSENNNQSKTFSIPEIKPVQTDSAQAILIWRPGLIQLDITGYNIYLSDNDSLWASEPGASTELKKCLVNAKPVTDTMFVLHNLDNGKEYFAQIRSIVNNTISDTGSKVVRFYPRPEGQVYLYSLIQNNFAAFEWQNARLTDKGISPDLSQTDFILIYDSLKQVIKLLSPHLVSVGSKHNGFTTLIPFNTVDDWYGTIDAPLSNYQDSLSIKNDVIIGMKTMDNYYAKLGIKIIKEPDNGEKISCISLAWAFQTRKGYYHY